MSKENLTISLDRSLGHQPPSHKPAYVVGQFGVGWHSEHQSWIVFNSKTSNCIAAIRHLDDKTVIRYREKSHWSPVILEHQFPNPTVCIPSLTLFRYSRWCKRTFQGLNFGGEPSIHDYRNAARIMFPSAFITSFRRQGRLITRDVVGNWRDNRGRFARGPAEEEISGREEPSRPSRALATGVSMSEAINLQNAVWTLSAPIRIGESRLEELARLRGADLERSIFMDEVDDMEHDDD